MNKRILIIFFILMIYSYIQAQEGADKKGRGVSQQEYNFAFSEATKFYLLGNIQQAINLYRECLKVNPQSSAVYFQISRMLYNAGKVQDAIPYALQSVRIDSNNVWYWNHLGLCYNGVKMYDSAIHVYRKIRKLHPENLNLYYLLISLYEINDQLDSAMIEINQLERKVGYSKELTLTKYNILMRGKKFDKALFEIQNALKMYGDELDFQLTLAEYYKTMGTSDSAFKYYRKVYHIDPENPLIAFGYSEFMIKRDSVSYAKDALIRVLNGSAAPLELKSSFFVEIIKNEDLLKLFYPLLDTLSEVYYKSCENEIQCISIYSDITYRIGNYAKSSLALKKLIAYDENNYSAYEQLLFAENALKNNDSVLYYASKTIERFANRPLAYLFAGSVIYQKRDYENALNFLKNGIEYADKRELKFEFFSLIAESFEKLGHFDSSEVYFKKALKLSSSNTSIKNNYAYYLSLRNARLRYALKLSRYTLKVEPENPTYLDTFGWILYMQNRLRKATKYVELAIKNGGNTNSEILLHYGDILYKRGFIEEALKTWKDALMFTDDENYILLKDRIDSVMNKFGQ